MCDGRIAAHAGSEGGRLGGVCANPDFFQALDEAWEQVGWCGAHVPWYCFRDELVAYRRR